MGPFKLLFFFWLLFLSSLPVQGDISEELKGKSLRINSEEFKTQILFRENRNVQRPLVKVEAKDGANPDFITFDGTELLISSNVPSVSTSLSVMKPLVLLLFAFLFPEKRGFPLVVLGFSWWMVSQSFAAGGYYGITVEVPSGFVFEEISIVAEGSFTGQDFTVRKLDILLGEKKIETGESVLLKRISLYDQSNIRSSGDLNIEYLQLLSPSAVMNFYAENDASITFQYFRGSFSLEKSTSSNTTLVGDHCSWEGSSSLTGNCLSGPSQLQVQVGGNLHINFGEECVDIPATSDFVPSSPPIPSNIPSKSYKFNDASLWNYRGRWNGDGGVVTSGENGTVVITETSEWKQDFWYLMCESCLPSLNSQFTYTFKFSTKDTSQSSKRNIDSMKVFFIRKSATRYMEFPGDLDVENPQVVVASQSVSSPFGNSWNSKTVSLQIPNDANTLSGNLHDLNEDNHVTLAIFASLVGDDTNERGSYSISDISLETNEVPYRSPTPLSKPSELISIPKPDTKLDPNPRTNCPWNENGLKKWEDPATWGGSVPSPTQTIVIPENTKVLVGSCSFYADQVYEKIVIPPTSELIFNDSPLELHVKNIFVQGKLRIGSEECRLFSPITITFHGPKTDADNINVGMGSKGIGVTGSIDIHGKQFHYTWTRLAASALPGEDRILLQDNVNWEVGQKIVILTTIRKDDYWDQNEIRTIKAINGKLVQLTEPLEYHHYGGQEYQAEVGLLSRRILLQGDESSDDENFGGHVLVSGEGRFSGVATYRMGQTNRLARYPIHFHLAGDSPNSFVRDCSFQNTFYRCIVLHGSNLVKVTRNVAFDAIGHCFYLEDGVEENNTISYNLAAHIHWIKKAASGPVQGGETFQQEPDLTQPADTSAAGFYITNAYNSFIGNAASGGWTGFAFVNLPMPIGLHRQVQMDPSGRPTLVFDGNTAHSSGYYWGAGSCMYVGGKLTEDDTGLSYVSGRNSRATRLQIPNESKNGNGDWNTWQSPKEWMLFTNTKVFLCQRGLNHWGDRVDVIDYEAHDITRGVTLFGESSLQKGLINGKSENIRVEYPSHQGFQFYDTWVKSILVEVEFRNFFGIEPKPSNEHQDNYAIISMTHSDVFKPQGISATRAITYTNVERSQVIGHRIQDTGSSRYFNFVDWDGSASYSPGAAIIGSHLNWWKYSSNCRKEWKVWICPKSSGIEIGNLEILVPGQIGDNENSNAIGNMTLWGDGVSEKRTSFITGNPGVTGITGFGWYMYLYAGSPTNFDIGTWVIPDGTYIMFAIPYPSGTTFTIETRRWSSKDKDVNAVSSLNELFNSNGYSYYFDGTNLYLKLINPYPQNPPYFERSGVKIYSIQNGHWYRISANCPQGDCSAPETIPTATFRNAL